MRKFQKMLAASVLISLPAVFASAQDSQGQGQFQGRNRQFGGQQDQSGNGNDQFGGGGRTRQRNNGGFGNQGGYGNNGGGNGYGNAGGNGFGNGNGGGRQRFNSDTTASTTPKVVTPAKSDTPRPFIPPVSDGPVTFQAQQLPKEFTLLNSRSIFSKNHVAFQPDAPKGPIFPTATAAALVFKGLMRFDTGVQPYQANIEDTNSSKPPTWVSEGDLLTSNGARVTEITLDHIVVEKNGARRLIRVGENLEAGEKLSTPASVAGSAAPTASAAAGSSPVKIAASSAGGTSDEDVADMMRRRRQQELGQ